jgi:hypothetical protein
MKQMISFTVPSSRVYTFANERPLAGGSMAMPSRPRVSGNDTALVPVGGLNCLDTSNSSSKLYVVVTSAGVPVLTGSPPRQKTYEACTPSQAAIKAFYAWWRHTEQGRVANSDASADTPVPLELSARLEELDVSQNDREAFLADWKTVSDRQLAKTLLVRLAAAGGSTAVRNYLVSYERNIKPNKLEVSRGIVVNARARLIAPSDLRREGVWDLESFA